jgi:hypothetical protein
MKTKNKKQNEIHVLIEKTKVNKPWQWEIYDYHMCRNYDQAYNIVCKRNELNIYDRDERGRFCTKFANTIEDGNRVSISSFCYGDSSYRTGNGWRQYEIMNINDFEPCDWAKMLSFRYSHYNVSMLFSMGFEFTFDLAKQIAMEEKINGHILISLRLFLQHCKEVTETESETEYIYTYTCGNESITIDIDNEKIFINE